MKRFIVLIVLVLVVAIVWTAGWFYVAGRVETEIAALANADGNTTPRVECADLSVGGFPFQFHPRCVGTTVTSGDVVVQLAQLDATALFYQPTHVQLFAQGPATITDSFYGSSQEVSWQALRGSIRLAGLDSIERISIVGSQLAYADAVMDTTVIATAANLEFHLVAAPTAETASAGDALDLYVTATDADMPAFQLADTDLVIDGRITGLPPLPQLAGMTLPDALARWQADNGMLTLRALDVTAEGLSVDAEGQASLDAAGLLNGSVSVVSQGLAPRLVFLDPQLRDLMVGTPGADGFSRQTITANAGTLQIGIIPISSVPPLF